MKFSVQWAIMGKISHHQRWFWKLHWSIQLVSGEACLAHHALSSPYILSYPTSEEWTSQLRMIKEWTLGNFYFLNKIKNKILISPLLPVLSSLFFVIQMHLKPYNAQDKLFILLCLSSCFSHHFLLLSPYISYFLLSIPHSPINNLCSFLPSYTSCFFFSIFTLTPVMPAPFSNKAGCIL